MRFKSIVVAVACAAPLIWVGAATAQFGFGQSAPTKKIAYFKIGAVTETPQKIPPLFGGEMPVSMKDLLARIKKARNDENVKAIILDLQGAVIGIAQLQELHTSLSKSDKDVFVHTDSLTTGTYALATAASHISVVPTGEVWLTGLYGESPYLKGAFDKLGIIPDFEHSGDYKTAAETYTRTGPSPQSQEMTDWLLDSLYDSMVKLIADRRGFSAAKVKELIDNGPYTAEEALEAKLIDSVKHRQDFIKEVSRRFGSSTEVVSNYGADDPFADLPQDIFGMFNMMMQMFSGREKKYTEPSIALVYVEGPIMLGSGGASPFGSLVTGAYSTTIRKALDKAAADPSVKAVVLRVDSPGGSALASEIIWNAAERVKARKPFIVSMGNVAGSGGYYVACGADAIFADPATITASIGVVAGKLVTTGGWEKLGINWSVNQRGKMAGMLATAAPFSDVEREKLREYMATIYGVFKGRVTQGRGDKLTKPIDEMAGGRVFTGVQALELGLVDRLGGLEDAVKFASARAGVSDFEIRVIPEPPTIFDLFAPKDDSLTLNLAALGSPLLVDTPLFETILSGLSKVEPLRAEALMSALIGLDIIQKEGTVLMMPWRAIAR